MRSVWLWLVIIIVVIAVTWYPFYLFKEDALNDSFIEAEHLIRQAEAEHDLGNLDNAIMYLGLAHDAYSDYYYPLFLAGNWLWEKDLKLDAVIKYHQALVYNYKLDLAYERIIEFYQLEGFVDYAARYQQVRDDVFGH